MHQTVQGEWLARILDKEEQIARSHYSMNRYKCSVCHGNCDPGELIRGKCLECIEKEQLTTVMQNKADRLLNAPWEQMELDFGGNLWKK